MKYLAGILISCGNSSAIHLVGAGQQMNASENRPYVSDHMINKTLTLSQLIQIPTTSLLALSMVLICMVKMSPTSRLYSLAFICGHTQTAVVAGTSLMKNDLGQCGVSYVQTFCSMLLNWYFELLVISVHRTDPG